MIQEDYQRLINDLRKLIEELLTTDEPETIPWGEVYDYRQALEHLKKRVRVHQTLVEKLLHHKQ